MNDMNRYISIGELCVVNTIGAIVYLLPIFGESNVSAAIALLFSILWAYVWTIPHYAKR
jgi:hypothetical protein